VTGFRGPGFLSPFRRSLQARLIGSFVALSFITLFVVTAVAYPAAKRSLRNVVQNHLTSVSTLKVRELNRWVGDQTRHLVLVAGQSDVGEAVADPVTGPDVLRDMAAMARGTGEDFSEVFVLSGVGGRVIASTDVEHEGAYHTPDYFFTAGRSGPVVQNIYPSPTTGRPTLTVAAPIRGASGEVVAVLAANLNLDQVEQIVQARVDDVGSTESYLVTPTHEVVSATRFGLAEYGRGVHSEGIDRAVAGSTGIGLYENYRGVPVIGSYRWIADRELGFLVEISQEEALAPAARLMRRMVLFGAAAILFLLIGVRWQAVRVTQPIEAVRDAASRVAGGDFNALAPVRGEDEVGDLARSFNAMTDQLSGLYENLQHQLHVSSQTMVELQKQQSLIGSIIDNSTALIAVTDPDGLLRIANGPFLDLLGLSESEAVHRPVADILPEEIRSDWLEASGEAADGATIVEREFVWEMPAGQRTYLCVWFPLVEGGDHQGTGLIATDLSERKRVDDERLRLESQFRHAQKLESLGVLAGGIAHDFNNILAAVLGHADLASECVPDEPEEAQEHLNQVVAAARRAAELTNQMLAYAGKASFRVESLDLNGSIREITELINVSLPKKVVLKSELSAEPLYVRGDPAQISQVVMNLVTNAAQAIGDSPGTVTITTSAADGPGRDRARLMISDDGCGMSPEVLDRIFDPFFTTKLEGRGLGLAAVLGIVKGLDGSLDVRSEPGGGTKFTILFPMDVDPARRRPRSGRPPAIAGANGTVLVVDDEDAVRSFTRRALERHGYSVLEARDGLHALEVYRQGTVPIRALVLDMSMPGLGGREVFEILRRTGEEVPVLFTSGYDPSDAAGSLLDFPNVRFLQKPYRPGTLSRELEELLADRGVATAADGAESSTPDEVGV